MKLQLRYAPICAQCNRTMQLVDEPRPFRRRAETFACSECGLMDRIAQTPILKQSEPNYEPGLSQDG
jgi:hypothetical protein